jgi:tetratricopeptide (TPR) repeat protein
MVVPFFFLPMIYDSFGLGKSSFLLLSGVIGMILWVIGLIAEKKAEIKYSKWLWWVGVLFVWSVISFFRMSVGGQARSIASSLGIGGLMGLVIWSFLWLQTRSEEETKKQLTFLTISGLVVGVTTLIAFMIPASKLPLSLPKNNPILTITSGWTLVGSIIGEVVLFLFLTISWVEKLLKKLKDKVDFGDYFKEALAVAFFGLLTLLDVYKLVKLGWVYLDISSAWVIAVETLKNNPIFGVGPGNFVEAFSRFRPVSFNATKLWSNTFGVSSIGILNIWTELGTVGLAIAAIIGSMVLKKKKNGWAFKVILLGLLAFILPPNFLIWFLLFWVLSTSWGEVKTVKLFLPLGEKGVNIMPYLVSLLLLALTGFGGYKMARATLGDYFWRQSLLATSKNDGSGAYNNQIKAIGMNPTLADYRAVYAQTNLALAQNFLNVEKKEDLTEENKQKASTLIQQAVREGQAAVNLDQRVSAYWSNLGSVYKSLIGLVDSTLDWSVQSYQQAAILDPVNPNINMDLGSIAYGAGDYASAERYFEEVVKDKTDLANAWYNWAYAAKKQNKLQDAVTRLDQAVKLVPADSTDYDKANKELDSWKKELEEAVKKYQEQLKQQQAAATQQQQPTDEKKPAEQPLTTPQPLPTVGKEEKVNVPAKDLEPPQATVTPVAEH